MKERDSLVEIFSVPIGQLQMGKLKEAKVSFITDVQDFYPRQLLFNVKISLSRNFVFTIIVGAFIRADCMWKCRIQGRFEHREKILVEG